MKKHIPAFLLIFFTLLLISCKPVNATVPAEPVQLNVTMNKTQFYVGDTLYSSYVSISVLYSDSSVKEIELSECQNNFDSSVAKENLEITFSYGSLSAKANVSIKNKVLKSIELISGKTTTYYTCQTFTPSLWQVYAYYTNGSYNRVFDWTSNISEVISSAGTNKTITISYTENGITKQYSYKVNVYDVELSSISIQKKPNTLSYYTTDPFSTDGMIVKAQFNNGDEEEITDYQCNGAQVILTAGNNKPVTVSYTLNGITKEASYYVNVIKTELYSLRLRKNPTKTAYCYGETFDTTGMTLAAHYTDNRYIVLQGGDYTTDADQVLSLYKTDISTSCVNRTITFSYTEDGITRTATLNVYVAFMKSIEIESLPTKTEYIAGESFDASGLFVNGIYEFDYNGTVRKPITGYTCNGNSKTGSAGTKTVTVSYKEPQAASHWAPKEATFNISVKQLKSLIIVSEPFKKDYFVNDTFNPAGLVVKVNYSDNTYEIITNYTCDADLQMSTAGEKTITVSYTNISTVTKTFTINVTQIECTSLELISGPNKTSYKMHEVFDPAGIQLKAYYNNGSEELVSDYSTDASSVLSEPGINKTVNISFGGKSVQIQIDVSYVFHDEVNNAPAIASDTLGISGKYVYFGDCPQTLKDSSVTVDSKQSITAGSHTYYLGSDNYYYCNFKGKYYRVEPIKWRVVSKNYNGNVLLVCEQIVKFKIPFYMNTTKRIINGVEINHDNYKYSTVRAYLNGSYEEDDTQAKIYENKGFLQTAFSSAAQSSILTTEVDNGSSGYGSIDSSKYNAGENTFDKVFLLSINELTTVDYGFYSFNYVFDGSQFSKAVWENVSTDCEHSYLLRSNINPNWGENHQIRVVYDDGSHTLVMVNGTSQDIFTSPDSTSFGLIPAVCVDNSLIQ